MRNRKQNRKAFQAVLAVLIAVVLWLYVVNVENPTGTARLRELPIQIQGEEVLEENGLMVTDLSEDTLTVRLSGKKKTLMKVSRKNVTVTVDVSAITGAGDWTLNCRVNYPSNVGSESVSVSDWDDMKVTVTVEPRTTKEVPVRGGFIGTTADGYQAGTVTTDPQVLELSGPEDTLSKITYALAQIEESELSETLLVDAPVILMTENDLPADVANVTCDPTAVSVTVPVRQVVQVPLTVDLIPGGGATADDVTCVIKPESVTLVVDGTELPESISLGEMDLGEVFEQASYSLPIDLPQGATAWNAPEYASVSLTFSKLTTRQFAVDTSAIQMENIPEGFVPELVSERLYIWLRGPSGVLNAISAEDIQVIADLSGASTGERLQRFPVTVTLTGEERDRTGVVGTHYSIALRLTRV